MPIMESKSLISDSGEWVDGMFVLLSSEWTMF